MAHWIRAREAAEMLGIHPSRISVLIRQGNIAWRPDPLDARVHLVDEEQIEAILDERRELYGDIDTGASPLT
ncbi:MAG: helix-turn-helix domain-containing protein [Chloroflexota bacterium]